MKDFNDFLKTLPDANIGNEVQEKVMKAVENSTDENQKLASIIAVTSAQVTIKILAEYHKWIQQP